MLFFCDGILCKDKSPVLHVVAGRNAIGGRQEESGMLEKGTYRLMWQGNGEVLWRA